MRKLYLLGIGLCAMGALFTAEKNEAELRDDPALLGPLLAALSIEVGIFLLRRHQGGLLAATQPTN